MSTEQTQSPIRFALPKGHLEKGVFQLLADAGVQIRSGSRNYRPTISLPGFETKILRPQNMVEMLHHGSRELGFAAIDWVQEVNADVVELLDTGLDPVRIVAATPRELLVDGKLPKRKLVVAGEYENLTQRWIKKCGYDATFLQSHGATEVFPPEDADIIIDNTATGATLEANGLEIIDELMKSSTRLFAHPKVLEDPVKKEKIDNLVMLLESVLEARKRVMVEMNVAPDKLNALIEVLPCMRRPTVSTLHGEAGYAIKSAVQKKELPLLIPKLKEAGACDIVVTALAQIVP